jgi:hypothetical protein
MIRSSIDMTATINRMWMNPPSVKDVTIPSNHKIIRITAMVYSMKDLFGFVKRKRLLREPEGMSVRQRTHLKV